MQQILLAGSKVLVSRIAFGTASLHHLRSARERERLLGAAFDHGITHFDTSPYYGNGIGECSLACLGAGVSVATKVGLYPPGGAHASRLRLLANRALGRIVPELSRPLVDFTVARARTSLDGSLRRLRRERVDLLLLHEPRIELMATDEWQRWLESERDRVALTGVAGEWSSVVPFLAEDFSFARILQTRAFPDCPESEQLRRYGRTPHITYGHLVSCEDGAAVTRAVRAAFERAPEGVVLVSTRRQERLASIIRGAHDDARIPPARLSA